MGYKVIGKPLKYIKQIDGSIITKGNVDVEMTLGIINNLDNLDEIILVLGDSNFLTLVQDIYRKGKTVRIISFQKRLS